MLGARVGMKTRSRRLKVSVPDWAKDAVWYQILPERFRNGSPDNDPQVTDISRDLVPGWRVSRWGMDWYERDPWEIGRRGFYKSVYLRRYGGDLLGVREKLDYLRDLGVNAIYLNPIFMAPSLHKYDAMCLHHVDPTFGPDRQGDLALLARAGETENPGTWIWTAADRYLVDLVAEVHRRGMRIILDGVFNHVGTGFFAFQDVVRNGRTSRFAEWFRITRWKRNGAFDYKGWFGSKGLPEFARSAKDLAAPVRQYVFDITRRWMDPDGDGDPADGVDGWRLDVAFCVPHGFWKKWRALVKSINPEAFLTGEVVSLATDFLQGDEFDSVMNYRWLFPTVRFFSPGSHAITAQALREELETLWRAYPRSVALVLQNLLDSHDVGRIATVLENRLPLKKDWDTYFSLSRVAANRALSTRKPGRPAYDALRQLVLFQMTYPGAPMIYYGTEVGLWGANDPDNRQPMLWDDVRHESETHDPRGVCGPAVRAPDKRLFAFFRRAIALRTEHALLRRGDFRWLPETGGRLLAFARCDGGSEIRVFFNAGDEASSLLLDRPARDLWEGGRAVRTGRLKMGPRGWKVLEVQSGPGAVRTSARRRSY